MIGFWDGSGSGSGSGSSNNGLVITDIFVVVVVVVIVAFFCLWLLMEAPVQSTLAITTTTFHTFPGTFVGKSHGYFTTFTGSG
jgi:hypothetical protein